MFFIINLFCLHDCNVLTVFISSIFKNKFNVLIAILIQDDTPREWKYSETGFNFLF